MNKKQQLRDRLVPPRYIVDQRILQSDWLIAFSGIKKNQIFPKHGIFADSQKNFSITSSKHSLTSRKIYRKSYEPQV